MSIEALHITKTFGRFTALRDVSLTVNDGELLALLGPSGSGKTTLLRIVAGLETPDPDPAAALLFDGRDVTREGAGERRVGFVFQHYALFRNMTVFENIAFGLRVRPRHLRPSANAIRERVRELMALIQLDNFADRYPSQLSGGQRQRVALARALAIEPGYPDAHCNLALVLARLGSLDEAAVHRAECAKAYPSETRLRLLREPFTDDAERD